MDSSVAAHLLLRRGYEVVGVHMSNWDGSDERGQSACPETEDAKDAQVKNCGGRRGLVVGVEVCV